MQYHRITKIQAQDGGGVDAMVAWYDEDPEENPLAQVILNDAVALPAANVGQVTAEMIDEAILAKQAQLEATQAATVPLRADVAARIGRTHVVRAGRVERHERQRR